jgi:hypothetical protein
VMEAVCGLLHDVPDLAAAFGGDPIEWHGELSGTPVRLIVPMDMPVVPGSPEDLIEKLSERDDVSDDLLSVAEMLVEFAAQYHGAWFGSMSPEDLEELLLETLPAQLAVDADEAPVILAAARELLKISDGQAACVALLESIEPRLVAALGDPSKYGIGKQVVMAGIAEGYDMSSEQGVEDFVRTFAARAATKPSKSKSKAKKRAQRKPAVKAKAKAKPTKAKPKLKAKTKAQAKKPARKKR